MVVVFVAETIRFGFVAGFWSFFGIDEVSSAPIALDETPGARYVNGVPGVAETVVFETDTWLVTGGFGVAFDYDAVQTSITGKKGKINT